MKVNSILEYPEIVSFEEYLFKYDKMYLHIQPSMKSQFSVIDKVFDAFFCVNFPLFYTILYIPHNRRTLQPGKSACWGSVWELKFLADLVSINLPSSFLILRPGQWKALFKKVLIIAKHIQFIPIEWYNTTVLEIYTFFFFF